MTKNGRLLVFALVLAVLERYEKSSKKRYKSARKITSFWSVPDINQQEINAIKAIRQNYISLKLAERKWIRNEAKEKELGTNVFVAPEVSPENENNMNMKTDIPGVDTAKGLSLYGGDTKIYLALLRSYASNTPGNINKLRAVSKETLPDYVITVHGLRGTSAGIGAESIREAAMNLENLSRAGDFDGVLAHNDKLINDTEIILANVKTWLEQYDALNAKPRLKAPDREVLARLRQNCENYDMAGIDKAMSELESTDYEEGADLVKWLKERIAISEISEAATQLAQYEKELSK
jgi:Hpt domain.